MHEKVAPAGMFSDNARQYITSQPAGDLNSIASLVTGYCYWTSIKNNTNLVEDVRKK
jgi:hypothetical protein